MLGKIFGPIDRWQYRPPEYTTITPEAQNILHYWGLSGNDVIRLRQILGNYSDAYLRCPERIANMNTVYLGDYKQIFIPHAFGGSCADITRQFISEVNTTNALASVNNRYKDDMLTFYMATGSNPSHFKRGTHVWAALALNSQQDFQYSITFDPAFQEISATATNGYRINYAKPLDYPTKPFHKIINPSEIDITPEGIYAYDSQDILIGLSNDRTVSFAFGFTKAKDLLVPFLRVGAADGINALISLINPYTQTIDTDYRSDQFSLTQAAQQEAISILNHLCTVQFAPVPEYFNY